MKEKLYPEHISNAEVAQRVANAENEAFSILENSIAQSGLTWEQIIEHLRNEATGYDEEGQLKDYLFQIADFQRLKGKPIDENISTFLKEKYITPYHSALFSETVIHNIDSGDSEVVGHLLLDEKFLGEFALIEKLRNDTERTLAFSICKKRVRAGCSLINAIGNLDAAISLYEELVALADGKSYSDQSSLEMAGRRLAEKVYKTSREVELLGLVERGIFKLSYLQSVLPGMGSNQKLLVDLVARGDTAKEIEQVLRYVSDPNMLSALKDNPTNFLNLDVKNAPEAASLCGRAFEAASNEPEVISLSDLGPNEKGQYSGEKEARNKFVVGISQDNRYIIAWGNMKEYEYHKNIFEALHTRVGQLILKSGGYIGFEEQDGKTVIKIEKNSSDFGCYSREVLERFRPALEAALHEAMPNKELEIKIELSTGY